MKILMNAPMCGDIILIIMVRLIVVPTTRYHSTLKSVYLPSNNGKKSGKVTSETLALTTNMTTPCNR